MKGTNTSKAIASYENVNGEITYSISSDTCVTINSKTGEITAKPDSGDKNSRACLSANRDIEVTATTPGGKSATQILHYEKRLTATAGGTMFYSGTKDNGFAHDRDGTFTITTNMDVTWSASGSYDKSYSTYNGTTYKRKMINQGNGNAFFTVTSKSGQKIEMFCQFYGN